jgi:anti-sigma factor RsiW
MSKHNHASQCEHLLGILSEYIDGELQAELCTALEQHMQGCNNCRIVVNTLRKTVELYQQSNEPLELPHSVRERLYSKLNLETYLR